MSETALPTEVPTGIHPDVFLDHRLGDNEILAAFVRLYAMAIKARTWPVYRVGAFQIKSLAGFNRVDRARLTLRSMEALGLIEIEVVANDSLTLTIVSAA